MSSEPLDVEPGTAAPFSEPPETAEPGWIARDEKGRLLPGFPGPRYAGKATSTIARASKLIDASQPLVERRDTILRGGPDAKQELVRMLANSVVALDHFEKEIGARLVLEGPLTGKGYSKAALATAGNLATQKARLIDKLLPLLSLDEPRTASAPNLDHLTDEDVAAITAILDGAAARAENPEPEPPPAVHLRIELPSEDPS